MKRELIIGCRLFLMNTATHCVEKVYRIDDGKISLSGISNKEYRLPRDERGINALIDALMPGMLVDAFTEMEAQ